MSRKIHKTRKTDKYISVVCQSGTTVRNEDTCTMISIGLQRFNQGAFPLETGQNRSLFVLTESENHQRFCSQISTPTVVLYRTGAINWEAKWPN